MRATLEDRPGHGRCASTLFLYEESQAHTLARQDAAPAKESGVTQGAPQQRPLFFSPSTLSPPIHTLPYGAAAAQSSRSRSQNANPHRLILPTIPGVLTTDPYRAHKYARTPPSLYFRGTTQRVTLSRIPTACKQRGSAGPRSYLLSNPFGVTMPSFLPLAPPQ